MKWRDWRKRTIRDQKSILFTPIRIGCSFPGDSLPDHWHTIFASVFMAVKYSSHNLHVRARQAEQAGEAEEAVSLYNQALKNDPMDDLAYNRLMVYYRKRKEYRKELKMIQVAIAAHVRHAQDTGNLWLKKNRKTARTAKALVKSLGLLDRKGIPKLETRQIAAWRKRMTVVRKRLKQPANASK